MFRAFGAAAHDEFRQLRAPVVHRLTLAAQSLVTLLLGGDAHAQFVESFGERVFLRADRFRFLGGGGALGPETLAVGGGGLHAVFDGGGLLAGGLELFFGVRLFAAQAGDLAGEVARVAFQRDDLALERGELDLARLELAARVGQRRGGGLRAGGSVGAGGGGGVDLGLARGDFFFQRADLRLPLENACLADSPLASPPWRKPSRSSSSPPSVATVHSGCASRTARA